MYREIQEIELQVASATQIVPAVPRTPNTIFADALTTTYISMKLPIPVVLESLQFLLKT